jgi:NTE family protein
MTGGAKRPVAPVAEPYSPRRRSAVLFAGTGTAGAYHAGAWRALHEAGARVDVVAGQGVGAVSALLTAIDAGGTLWSETGLWRPVSIAGWYPWHPVVRLATAGVAVAALLVAFPAALAVVGAVVVSVDFAGQMVGLSGGGLARAFASVTAAAFDPAALPTWVPRLAVVVLGTALVAALLVAAIGARGRAERAPVWRRLVPSPLSSRSALDRCWAVTWEALRGASDVRQPASRELARRCTELVAENLGQPGFRELVIGVHDLDTRRDVVFALVAEPQRRSLTRRGAAESDSRRGEIVDLTSHSKQHLADAVAAALAVPVVTEAHPTRFEPDSYWRGETHRLCDRPGVLHRLVDELSGMGVEQIVLVSSAPEVGAPHSMAAPRLDGRGRMGEYVQASEAACVRDVERAAAAAGRSLYVIRPAHNPVGPFDFSGGFDDRSHRRQPVFELMAQGYEDAYRQFVERVMGPSGDTLG